MCVFIHAKYLLWQAMVTLTEKDLGGNKLSLATKDKEQTESMRI